MGARHNRGHQRTERGLKAVQPWKPESICKSDQSDEEKKKRLMGSVRSLLNKVTPTTFPALTKEFLDLKVHESPALDEVVSILVNHAVMQPKACRLFLNICQEQISMESNNNNDNNSLFHNCLLRHAQNVFREFFDAKPHGISFEAGKRAMEKSEMIEGISEFIGHLFLQNTISIRIILSCIIDLLKSVTSCWRNVDEESVECAVRLLKIIGKRLEEHSAAAAAAEATRDDKATQPTRTPAFRFPLDDTFKTLTSAMTIVSNRLRFMIMDLVELRARGWQPEKNAVPCVWRACDEQCGSCDRLMHLVPFSFKQNLVFKYPQLKLPHYSIDLDEVICTIYEKEKICDFRRRELQEVMKRLNVALQFMFRSTIFRLDVFGSSENGFGSNRSDFDVCFRYIRSNDDIIGKHELKVGTQQMTIVNVENSLRFAGFDRVTSIIAAKVPIVKFSTTVDGCEINGDISYYSELALHNTRLLKRYCSWTKDEVVSKLGVFIKRWAKTCDICDAARGSLCAYAYMILLVHFLQRLQPHPLLPVLQEMGAKREIRVSGWNVYFCDDAPQPNWSKCTLSVGELFLQFLEFYSKFDWNHQVVQIRQSRRLTKIERGWDTQMCIEDPFNLDVNLSSIVSKQMFAFIRKSFATSRHVFLASKERGLFIGQIAAEEENDSPEEFAMRCGNALLAKCKSLIGAVPREPQCYACGRIGHFALKCRTTKAICFVCNATNSKMCWHNSVALQNLPPVPARRL